MTDAQIQYVASVDALHINARGRGGYVTRSGK